MRRLIRLMIVSAVTSTLFACSGNGNDLLFIPSSGGTGTPAVTLTSIAVTPNLPSIGVGATQQFTATGTYSDSSTQNLTASVTWDSSNKSVATIDSAGLATSVAAGPTTITATSGSISGNTILTVTAGSTNGTLDTSFNGTGKVTTTLGVGYSAATSVAVQSNGMVVLAGYSYNGLDNDFALARYTSAGILDSNFGTGGKVMTDFGLGNDTARRIAIQSSDGKIVAAGSSYNGSTYDFALARYNSDGSLDTIFGSGGKVTTDFAGANDLANSVAIQSDGKIVVAGYATNAGGNNEFAVARYNGDGSLDTTFGTGGKVTTSIGGVVDNAESVAIQPADGKIVVAGRASIAGKNFFALARYNTNGSLDTTFDTDGKVTTAIGGSDDFASSVAIQSDGKIVAAGYSYINSFDAFALTRYNTNGSLDTSFGTNGDGKVTTSIGPDLDIANSVTIQTDGKIVAAGYSTAGGSTDFSLARYNADGTLDTSFGSGGKLMTPVGSFEDQAYSVAIQPDGKIVAAGFSMAGGKFDFAVVRYK